MIPVWVYVCVVAYMSRIRPMTPTNPSSIIHRPSSTRACARTNRRQAPLERLARAQGLPGEVGAGRDDGHVGAALLCVELWWDWGNGMRKGGKKGGGDPKWCEREKKSDLEDVDEFKEGAVGGHDDGLPQGEGLDGALVLGVQHDQPPAFCVEGGSVGWLVGKPTRASILTQGRMRLCRPLSVSISRSPHACPSHVYALDEEEAADVAAGAGAVHGDAGEAAGHDLAQPVLVQHVLLAKGVHLRWGWGWGWGWVGWWMRGWIRACLVWCGSTAYPPSSFSLLASAPPRTHSPRPWASSRPGSSCCGT